jgi:hypothetical protein
VFAGLILAIMGFGLGKRARRRALKLRRRSARSQWRLFFERRMRPDDVVLLSTAFTGIAQSVKDISLNSSSRKLPLKF